MTVPDYVVRQGDCLSLIARRFGFRNLDIIYDHPRNRELWIRRPNPNVLYPGDVVFIPERTRREVQADTEQVHHFRAKLPQKRLHLILQDANGSPLAGLAYKLEIEGTTIAGTTDGSGVLEASVPASSRKARLTVGKHVWMLNIGHLNPIEHAPDDGVSGILARLQNLGHTVVESEKHLEETLRTAIVSFQRRYGLSVTGEPDGRTKSAIKDAHEGLIKPPPTMKTPPPPTAPPPAPTSAATADPVLDGTASANGEWRPNPRRPFKSAKPLTVSEVKEPPQTPALCTMKRKQSSVHHGGPLAAASTKVAPNTPNIVEPLRRGKCALCESYADCLDNDYNFLLRVAALAEVLNGNASYLMGIMHTETVHTYRPFITNPHSGATGLIQFMPSTASGLGTTTATLRAMCRIEQMDWVEKYFKRLNADFDDLRSVVLAVFEPRGLDPNNKILGVCPKVVEHRLNYNGKTIVVTPEMTAYYAGHGKKGKHGDGGFIADKEGHLIGVTKDKVTDSKTVYKGQPVDVTDDMIAYYDGHGTVEDGGVIVNDAGDVIGVNPSKTFPYADVDGKNVFDGMNAKQVAHMQAVYTGNSVLDADQDNVLTGEEYPGLVKKILNGCGEESAQKARDLQTSVVANAASLEYFIVPLSADTSETSASTDVAQRADKAN